MRALTAAALCLSALPAAGCINFNLANDQPNVFQAEIDADGAGFGKKNINFGNIVTLDLTTDEGRAGCLATDTLNFEPIQVEFHYILEDMITLEELLDAGNPDPRGLAAGDDPKVFQVGDPRLTPFTVGMFVTYTRKVEVTNDNGNVRKVRVVESRPAYCNFLDPKDENRKGCFTFDANVTGGIDNLLGSVGGVNAETTISGTFDDLIVYDEEEFQEILDANPAAEAADLVDSILLRIAQDKQGKVFVFNANLGFDLE